MIIPPTAAAVFAALAEEAAVAKANADVMAANREIRWANDGCRDFFRAMLKVGKGWATTLASSCCEPQIPLPNRMSPEGKKALEDEAEYQEHLRTVTPEEWEVRISLLPENKRCAVAKLVWWDFFGDRLSTERWDHLDRWLSAFVRCHHVSDDDLRLALMAVGYSEYQAQKRVTINDN